MRNYIVVSEGPNSRRATLAKLHYSGRCYEVVASGEYADLIELAENLNEGTT
jgi:hypothetical protein